MIFAKRIAGAAALDLTIIFLFALAAASHPAFSDDAPRSSNGSAPTQSTTSKGTPPPTSTSERPDLQSASQLSEKQLRENWRRQMLKTPVPSAGCYTSAFPSTQWQEVPCSTAKARPHPPAVAGAGNDPFASVVGSLSSATGSLLHVTGVTQESDPGGQNSYSLQLNTNTFQSATLCAGQARCRGWQQFIRDNPGNVYIQYWLINHASPCPTNPANFPDGWQFFPGAPNQASGCFINGNQTPVQYRVEYVPARFLPKRHGLLL